MSNDNIEVVRKRLGAVTAYRYAVTQGYTGTEQEFAELMASYASIAQDVSAESLVAEGYALGKQNGVDVGDQSPYYHANAKYHAEQAAESARTLTIDRTLTQAGQAADAKVTGDEIEGVKRDLNTLNDYFVDCINLFNPDDPDIENDKEIIRTGVISSKTGFFVSGYIPVIAGRTICLHYPVGTYGASSCIVLYDENKNYIEYVQGSLERLTDDNNKSYVRYTFRSDTSARYCRVTGYTANISYYMYVYADSMPSTYVAYTSGKILSDDVKVDFANVENVSISKSDTDFIKTNPKNLNDLSSMVAGIISNASANGDLDASATTWMSTDYIPVKPNTTYSLYVEIGVYYGANNKGIAYYDANKNYLGRVQRDGGASASQILSTITIPNNNAIAYIRTSYRKTNVTNHKRWFYTMIVEGSQWVGNAYIPFDGSNRIQDVGLSYNFSEPLNCLFGKLAIWNGDSICAADNDPNGGWPMIIAKANGMRAKNYGIAGGTIAENTGVGVHSVSATLDGMLTDFPDADYIVIEGGTNDADILGDSGIGTFDANDFTDAYIEALDKDTFSGALESIFYRLVTTMKGKHIGYLIPQKMGHTEVLVTRRRTYFDRAIAICQKWGIPYLDLWNGFYFNWRLSAHWDQTKTSEENNTTNNFYRDGQHLTDYGYAVESSVIAEWMKTI